jgi:penicillin-binding protein 2
MTTSPDLPSALAPVQTWPASSGYAAAGMTRTGTRRDTNQDAFMAIPPAGNRPWLIAVADGVGGRSAGEVASHAALEALGRTWRAAWGDGAPATDPTVALYRACVAADDSVRRVATAADTRGAATTLTAVTVDPRGVVVAQAGDSAAWVRDTVAPLGTPARRVTPEFTVIAQEDDRRARDGLPPLSATEVTSHPERGVITTYLGMPNGCPIHVETVATGATLPAVILACTDGVTDVMTLSDLDRAIITADPEAIVDRIARTVNVLRGGDDATVVVLVAATTESPIPSTKQPHVGTIVPNTSPAENPRVRPRSGLHDPSDPYGLRAASRGPSQGAAWTTTRRALAVGGVGILALATGAGIAWGWPLAERIAGAFRGAGGVDPVLAARDYFAQAATGDFAALWLRLSSNARREVSQEDFARRHRDFLAEISAPRIAGEPVPGPSTAVPGGRSATVTCDVAYASTRFGELRARVALSFVWEDDAWRLDWSPAVLLPNLTSGRRVRVASDAPTRGTILDRAGKPLASLPVASPGAEAATPSPKATPTAIGPTPSPTSRVASRLYPAGEVAGPLVGYTAEATPEELAALADRGYVAGDRVGRAGLERVAEAHLAGARGSRLDVLEPSGIVVTTLATVPPRHGGTVVTTLDLDLQRIAEAALGERPGSIVAIELPSGAIRAAATWPRYDPSAFETGRGVADLLQDPRKPLFDRPVQGLYPPGSTFKVVTMAAAMAHGVATPESEFTCTGTWTGLPGVSQRCWLKSGHGTITLADGLTQSCNSVFYELGKRLDALDASLLPAVARQAGLGAVTGAFPGEEPSGLVPDATWKRATLKEPWTPGDSVNLAIGQGQLLVSPLQLVAAYGMIATGQPIVPNIVAAVRLPGGNVEQAIVAPTPAATLRAWTPAALGAMRASLAAAVSSRNGTAVGAFAGSKVASMVAGKTGTAENQPGKPTHAWFAGYGPTGTPTVAVVAMVEQGGEGSGVAAPIARKVLEAALAR